MPTIQELRRRVAILLLVLTTAPGCSDPVEKTGDSGSIETRFTGNDAGRCPISTCQVSTGGTACCDCRWISSPLEAHACSATNGNCYTFCSSCLPESYQLCDGAEGSLLALCRSTFADGGRDQ